MKTIRSAFFIQFVIFSVCGYAQSDFREGFVILNSGDSLSGFVDFKSSRANAHKCFFRETMDAEILNYYPADLRAYRYTNSKYYISKEVDIDDQPQMLFLEYLVDGVVDIFFYRDESGEHYLVEDEQGRLRALKNQKTKHVVDGVTYEHESKQYLGMLKSVFEKSDKTIDKIEQVRLTHKSLITVAEDYHYDVCDDQTCIVYEKKIPTTFQYGLLLGITKIMFEDAGGFSYYEYFDKAQADENLSLNVGGFMKLGMPVVSERLFLKYEFSYAYIHWDTQGASAEESNIVKYQEYANVKQHALKNNFLLAYEFPRGFLRPVFELGGFLDYYFIKNYERYATYDYGGSTGVLEVPQNTTEFKNVDVGLVAGLGVKHLLQNKKELILDFRYQRGFNYMDGILANYLMMQFSYEL